MFPESDGHCAAFLAESRRRRNILSAPAAPAVQRYGLELLMTPRLESVRFRITPPRIRPIRHTMDPLPQAASRG